MVSKSTILQYLDGAYKDHVWNLFMMALVQSGDPQSAVRMKEGLVDSASTYEQIVAIIKDMEEFI